MTTKPLNEARKYTMQRDFEHQLRLFTLSESIEILARATANMMARDPTQFPHLANLFKHALDREYTYLTTQHSGESISRHFNEGAS
jgi:hypothetical protein